jgi:hypothetical protein
MGKLVIIVVLSAAALLGQTPGPVTPFPLFPPDLQKYLELTSAQVDAIRRADTELELFRVRKQLRVAQVQREIREWTAKDLLDPMQLGLRYVELETINREIREEEKKTIVKARAVLNPAQLAKLKVLEDAVKLQPLINDAVCENLIEVPSSSAAPGGTAGCLRGVISAVLQP